MPRIFTLFAALLIAAAAYAQGQLHYIALELDSLSRQRVTDYAQTHLPWADASVIAHHMTMLHHTGLRTSFPAERTERKIAEIAEQDYVLAWALAHEGEVVTLVATEVGHSDRAFALRITDTVAPSRNRIKHITLATNPAGGSAVDSNYIVDWTPLPEPFVLQGRVTIFYK